MNPCQKNQPTQSKGYRQYKPKNPITMVLFITLFIGLLISPTLNSQSKKEVDTEKKATDAPKEIAKTAKEDTNTLIPIPIPRMEHLEKSVSKQIEKKRSELKKIYLSEKEEAKKRAESYCELGQYYHAYELHDAAEACYRNAVKLYPKMFKITYCLAYYLQSVSGKYDEALELYRQLRPGHGEMNLIYLVHIRIGECYMDQGKNSEAKVSFEAAYRLVPEGAAVLARLGEIALKEKNYEQAVKLLSQAIHQQPEANQLHYPLAMAYRGMGDMKKARYHLEKKGMVGVQPPDPLLDLLKKLALGYRVHILAGKSAYGADRYEEAADSFEKAVVEEPNKAPGRINLGATLVKLGKFKEAMVQFQAALKIEPENKTLHFNLGTLYTHMGDYPSAIRHLKKTVDINSGDAEALLALADALRNNNQSEEAIKNYWKGLRLEPQLTNGWLNMTQLMITIEKYDDALNALAQAHNHMPHNGPIAHAYARLLTNTPDLTKRNGELALKLAMNVFAVVKNYDHARTIAFAYAQLEQCDKAQEWMNVSIQMAQNSKQSKSIIEMLKRNQEHFKKNRPCRIPGKEIKVN